MTTSQVALKGLQRCLNFTEMQRDSQSSFYSSGIESLQQIRDLAAQICLAANDALAKVGLNEPQSIVKSSKNLDLSDIEECVNNATEQAVLKIFNQLNIVNQQNISIDISTIDNKINVDSSVEPAFEDLEPIEVCLVESNHEDLDEDKPSDQFLIDFKTVLHKTSSQSSDKFKFEESKEFADLISCYFDVRFSKKYDKFNNHWFSQRKVRDYLASVFLSYCDAVTSNQSEKFVNSFYSWIESIKEKSCKYTLPGNSASMFFEVLNKSPDEIVVSISDETLNFSHDLWNDLWVHGYFNFSTLIDSKFCPTSSLSWIQDKLSIANSVYQDLVKSDIEAVYEHWVTIAQNDTYDLCRAIAIRSSPLLQTLNYYDNVKLPDEVLHESLELFVKSNKFTTFEDIEMRLKSIDALIEVIDQNYTDISDSYEYIKDIPPGDLDLIDVLECYASHHLE